MKSMLCILLFLLICVANAGAWEVYGVSAGTGSGDVTGGSASASGEAAVYGSTTGKVIGRSYYKLSGPVATLRTYTFPDADATVCVAGSSCSGYQTAITNPVTGTGTQYYWTYWNSSSAITAYHMVASKVACSDSNGAPVACTNLTDIAYASASTPVPATTCTNQFLSAIATSGSGTCTAWPTFNQNTSGTATKATNMVGGNSTTLLGSLGYQSNTDTTTMLGPNTTTTKKFLGQTGTGSNGAAPAWDTLAAGDIPTLTSSKFATGDAMRRAGIQFTINEGGGVISGGIKGDLEVPYAATIKRVTVLCDQIGSIIIDIWKDTYANFPPTVTGTITASAKPTVSAGVKAQDSTLTGWTTSLAAGDILRFNVDSASTVTRCLVSLVVEK